MRLLLLSILATISFAPALSAAEFSFFSILRAGLPGNGDWEIGTGPNGNTISNPSQYRYGQGTPGWSNNVDQQFRIGYVQSTNMVYATVWGSTGIEYTSRYNPVGGLTASPGGTWTIDTGSLYVSATPRTNANGQSAPSSIRVENLELSSAVDILQPMNQTSLYASQPTGTSLRGNTTPIVFSAAANGGDWYLDGTIRFTGLASSAAGAGAQRSSLQFGLTATYSDTPEPAAVLLVSGGLVWMAYRRRRRSMA
jgi:hypothetical protein